MKKHSLISVLVLVSIFALAGCVVRTYPVTKDRIDQNLSAGNQGYMKGAGPQAAPRKTTRTTQVVEIELHSPIKFERMPKVKPVEPKAVEQTVVEKTADEQLWGNRGYLTESIAPEIAQPAVIESYKVQKSDTLQKISKKFYGTTKKWNKIYQANKDTLRGPDKIYPGQTLNIPLEPAVKEPLRETKENLK